MAIIPTPQKESFIKREQLLIVFLGIFISMGIIIFYLGYTVSKKGGEIFRFRTETPIAELKIDFSVLKQEEFKNLKLPINLPIKPLSGGRNSPEAPFLPF